MSRTASAVRLDTMRTVETPEGCRIDLRVAGLVARARAWLVDLAIRLFSGEADGLEWLTQFVTWRPSGAAGATGAGERSR